jgi:acyl-CoA thioesterase-1
MSRAGWSQRLMLVASLLFLMTAPSAVRAQVVAFGASNVEGHGLPRSQAYAAQLEGMLRAKGLKVHVKNAGVYGDTSAAMLARMDRAIPRDTKVVILDTSGELLNNYMHGISESQGQADIATMTSRLEGRGIVVIPESTQDIAMDLRQPDGKHLTPEGHRVVAARLVDPVARALGQ